MFEQPCNTAISGIRDGRTVRRICTNENGPFYQCSVSPTECHVCHNEPSLLARIQSYKAAVREWKAAGKPERSAEETTQIFHQFCKPCERLNSVWHVCAGCGCRVSATGAARFNKIKMATQHCPRGLW